MDDIALRALPKNFSTYVYIGVLNTLIHGCVFLALHGGMAFSQATSNLCAFAVAATFSFHANARYTFRQAASLPRYLAFVGFMAVLSFTTGWLGDWLTMPGLVTLVVFSGVSLVLGYCYSSQVVFRDKAK
ncbi:GtrA family protein [Pseudomonas sp. RHF3.3-3]|uniref:Bactoprenol-linked glucose translocase n=1 Tax=Pseudomonas asplenii TaxID=53407 RepID=A0A0M9GKL4_9PSED|nr:GtrA family protein [Pseudomonas fuscovaginae]KPA93268.1 putative membrane protein [Pseudomonas fuscovaginae]KPA98553.1 putative membrane protein [Pseudomonas fuscovaginae]